MASSKIELTSRSIAWFGSAVSISLIFENIPFFCFCFIIQLLIRAYLNTKWIRRLKKHRNIYVFICSSSCKREKYLLQHLLNSVLSSKKNYPLIAIQKHAYINDTCWYLQITPVLVCKCRPNWINYIWD